ncbi:alpha/beta fold hydrolase [Polycyclovorans algicola]|uniref:alpha/beta fold hydrolase n=1 Tax=Polycyclovorans algicola TaxID=616992 RepID=UPI000694AE16|nr:alpha/beta hydrolase [Polycyclovorans algicola]
MAYADLNGTRIAWQQMGSGPDLVLVHGLAASRAFWFAHAMQLREHYTVTLFDLPGHGYSDRPASGYDSLSLGRLLLELMDTLEITEASLVGHSYGGAACIEAAVLAPQRVNGLALLDVRSLRIQPTMRMSDVAQFTPFETEIAADTRVDWSQETQAGVRFLEMAARHRVEGRLSRAGDPVIPFAEGRGALKGAKQWLALLDETDARNGFNLPGATLAQLQQISLPTLLMYADHSRCLTTGEALQRLWPQSRYELIEDAGHFFPMTHAGHVSQSLMNWATDVYPMKAL